MNFFRELFKGTERRYLRSRIVWERPDLSDKPFGEQLNTYTLETIKAHIDKEVPKLPVLLERALAYEATESIGHYYALYWLYREKYMQLMFEHADELVKSVELTNENIEARSMAKQAVDIVTDVRNPNNRLN